MKIEPLRAAVKFKRIPEQKSSRAVLYLLDQRCLMTNTQSVRRTKLYTVQDRLRFLVTKFSPGADYYSDVARAVRDVRSPLFTYSPTVTPSQLSDDIANRSP